MNKVCLISIPLLIAGCLLVACTSAAPTSATPADEASVPSPVGTGTVEIRATDAPPTGVSRIDVTVSGIEVHKADAAESSWVIVVEEEKTFNLVDMEGVEVFLGEKEIDAGQYTQIRLEVVEIIVTYRGQRNISQTS